VLADTTYNPLSIDEVAAAHVNADCVVRGLAGCGDTEAALAVSNAMTSAASSPLSPGWSPP
jgi:hypothetical protein